MMNNEKVSIIVPVYNCEKYVGECLESLINQTYKNIEIILINDGSKDNSDRICGEYAARDSRIKYISKQNEGVSKTRNIGLDTATGDYILFVDSDDKLTPSAVNILIDEVDGYDLIQFGIIEETANGELRKCFAPNVDHLCKNNKEIMIDNVVAPELTNKNHGFMGYSRTIWSKFYKKSILNDIRFKSNMKFYEDGEFCINAYMHAKKIKFINEYLYFYRNTEGSCMRKYRENIHDEICTVLGELKTTLDGINRSDLYDYAKLDMYCLELNNLLKKEFSYKEVKNICSNTYWDFKNMKMDMSGYRMGRKMLYFFGKHKMHILTYLLCKIKSIKR